MKPDPYTKVILTVIAFCLLILVVDQLNLIPRAYANNPSSGYAMVPLNEDGSINVRIQPGSSNIDVNIKEIDTHDRLDVNLEEVGGYHVYRAVPVEVK